MTFDSHAEYYTYDDVLIKPKKSGVLSRKDVDTSTYLTSNIKLKVPLINSNMDTVCSEALSESLFKAGGISTIHQFMSIEEEVKLFKKLKNKKILVIPTTGVTKDYKQRYEALVKAGSTVIMFDTPHAHTTFTIEVVKEFKRKYPKVTVICGNIASAEAARDLCEAGVDILKVGIGAGAGCLTRVKTGVGVPQFTAVLDCSKVAHEHGKKVIADSGAKQPADFAKALGAGADFLMMGRVFASTSEAPGEEKVLNGKLYKVYRGSSSMEAKIERSKNDKNYKGKKNEFIEGGSGLTEVLGSVADVVSDFHDGLRSAFSYVGANNLKEFQERVEFIKISPTVLNENGLHGMIKNV